jgi:hypothetical protein
MRTACATYGSIRWMITAFLAKHERTPKELKTHAFINGGGGWSTIDADERKAFLPS